jgi:hypothetical protein
VKEKAVPKEEKKESAFSLRFGLVGGTERLREREPLLDLERVLLRERLAEAASLRSTTI